MFYQTALAWVQKVLVGARQADVATGTDAPFLFLMLEGPAPA